MDLKNIPIDPRDLPEIEENPYHPMNDQHNREIRHVQQMIMAQQRQMRPQQVQMVKMSFTGTPNTKIAEEMNLNPATIGKNINSPEGQRLMTLLKYLDSAMAGPTASHRVAMLYRIAVDNESKQPKVSIAAVAEMNKMEQNQHVREVGDPSRQTNITINQNYFPRTPLDG